MMINILLVDDHQIVRSGLKLLLQTEKEFNVIGDVESVDKAIDFLGKDKNIDVIITDLNLPDKNGTALIRYVTEKFPDIKVIVLSMHFQVAYAIEAMDLGAKAYVSKDANEDEIIEAIRKVYAGEVYFAKTVAEELAKDFFKQKSVDERDDNKVSRREKEILKFIVEGLSNKMIADKLSLSENTINTHRYNIMKKLGARNSAELVRMAILNDLV